MRYIVLYLGAVMTLAGCASTPRTKVVRVPVPTPCLTPADIPVPPPPLVQPMPDDARRALDLALANLALSRAFVHEARAVMMACHAGDVKMEQELPMKRAP